MTFEQFQATRREMRHSEIGHDDESYDPEVACFVYLGALFIEKTATWKLPSNIGAYYLILGNEQTVSDNLPLLERHLYDWAVSSGYELPEVTRA